MSDISVNENYVLLPQELGLPKENCKYCTSKKSLFFKITEQDQPEPLLEKVHGSKSYFFIISSAFILVPIQGAYLNMDV